MGEYRMDILDQQDQLFKYTNDLHEMRRLKWINMRSRVVIVSLTTYNFDLDLWASLDFIFELPPGGKVQASYIIRPFKPNLTETEGELTETILDFIRCIIGMYILVFIGMSERRHKTKNHKAGARYYASLNGVCDVSISVLIFVSTIWRFVAFRGNTSGEFLELLSDVGQTKTGFYS